MATPPKITSMKAPRGGTRFQPGNAGRPKGSVNKKTRELADRIAERLGPDWCPVTAMAEIAEQRDLPVELRLRALAEVAPYVVSKRKPQSPVADEAELVEAITRAKLAAVQGSGGSLIELLVMSGIPDPDPESAVVPVEPSWRRESTAVPVEPANTVSAASVVSGVPASLDPPAAPVPVPQPKVSAALGAALSRVEEDWGTGPAITEYDPYDR